MSGYEAQDGVLPIMLDALNESERKSTGVDPVDAPFLRCVAEYGCPGHGGQRDAS